MAWLYFFETKFKMKKANTGILTHTKKYTKNFLLRSTGRNYFALMFSCKTKMFTYIKNWLFSHSKSVWSAWRDRTILVAASKSHESKRICHIRHWIKRSEKECGPFWVVSKPAIPSHSNMKSRCSGWHCHLHLHTSPGNCPGHTSASPLFLVSCWVSG